MKILYRRVTSKDLATPRIGKCNKCKSIVETEPLEGEQRGNGRQIACPVCGKIAIVLHPVESTFGKEIRRQASIEAFHEP